MCSSCIDGYELVAGECVACASTGMLAFRTICSIVGATLASIYLVRSTIQGALQDEHNLTILFKIFLSGVQLNDIVLSLPFSWPPMFDDLKAFGRMLTDFAGSIFNLDCLLQGNRTLSTFRMKVVLYAFLPLFVVVICILAFFLDYQRQLCKNRRSPADTRKDVQEIRRSTVDICITTIVILIFIVQPNIMLYTFRSAQWYILHLRF